MTGAVGVVGARGAVGRAAVRQLLDWGIAPIRLGGRTPRPVAGVDSVPLDVTDPDQLAAFCAACDTVVNCAGPAGVLGERVARAAIAAGAALVDASGDDTLPARLSALAPRRPVLVSAGVQPGLTGLLPRALAAGGVAPGASLTGYVGGRDQFTPAAAADYLVGDGEPLAAWRGGTRRSRALVPLVDVALPYFPEAVTAQPYLSGEIERLARRLGLDQAHWYSVFGGRRVLEALRRPGVTPLDLCRASELDLFGRRSYCHLVCQLDDATLVLCGTGASALTGVTTALATRAVLGGLVPAGAYHAAEVLDPTLAVRWLRDSHAVVELSIVDMARTGAGTAVEEGVL
jgi:Saccharopine dehydrogenase NADP binding domain